LESVNKLKEAMKISMDKDKREILPECLKARNALLRVYRYLTGSKV